MDGAQYGALMKNVADVEEQYKKWKELKREDIESLRDWLKLQPHLPKLDELSLTLFHHSCYYRNEATKQCIETYCTAITNTPEFFSNVDPFEKENALAAKSNCISILPKLTPDGHVIGYASLLDTDPAVFNFDAACYVAWASTCLDFYRNGCRKGHVLVISFKGVTLRHIGKISLISMKKLFHLAQLHVHNNTSILDYLPKECLPQSLGGTLGTDKELQEASVRLLEDNAEFIKSYLKEVRTDESKRVNKDEGENAMFGIKGSFKKLDID